MTNTLNSLWCTILLVCLSFNSFSFSENNSNHFCSLDCNNQINLSLPESGVAEITPDMISSASGCVGILEIQITDNNGINIGNTVNCSHVGQTLMVSVIHPSSGNSCWGNVLVEDKLIPSINCIDIEVNCNEDTSPANTGIPSVSDNCLVLPNPTYSDVMESLECSDPNFKAVIKRTWTVTDIHGNTNSCEQNIFIRKLDINQVIFPPSYTTNCDDLNLDPSITGEPTINGISIGSSCNLMVIHSDGNPFSACGGGYQFIRQWFILDWCTDQVITGNQTIEVTDTTPPIITCPMDITINTTSNDCTGSITLPPPTVTDNCSNFTISTLFNFPNAGNTYTGISIGTHPVVYTASDDCGNSSTCTFHITVKDLTAPIAVCDNPTQVVIGIDGTAEVNAITFDDGSTDNCGIDTFLVRRMDDPNFSGSVNFTCSDVGDTVMVILQVIDECGNQNECMVEAIIDDNFPPTINCPADLTIDCNDLPNTTFTPPTFMDNCGLDSIYFIDDSSGFNPCNLSGVITREWFALDFGGLVQTCTQSINIENNESIILTFPENDTISCNATYDPNISGVPTISEGCHDIVEVVIDSIRLGNNCDERLLIRWGFYDNCADSFLVDTATQIIYQLDLTPPTITCQDTIFSNPDLDGDCFEFLSFIAIAADTCSGVDTITNDYASSFAPIGFSVAGNFPIGETTVTFNAFDFCGNQATCETVVIVEGNDAPMMVCPDEIPVLIPPFFGSTTIDINNYADQVFFMENCQDVVPVILDESTLDLGTEVSCSDFLGTSYNDSIIVSAMDADGNTYFCNTVLRYVCGWDLLVAGRVETEDHLPIDDVLIKTISDSDTLVNHFNGFYLSDSLIAGNDYTIIPEKNSNPLNGVTTFDLVLISKHILGTELLDSPYKIIAADANNSGSITALDLVILRSLILHSIDEFPNSNAWRFIDADYNFDDPLQPFSNSLPENKVCLDISTNEFNLDFVGIKVGDVNQTSSPNNFATIDSREKEETLQFHTINYFLKKNQSIKVPIFAKDFENIIGCQFSLNFNPQQIKIIDVEKNIFNKNNFGFKYQEEGVLTCSWIKNNLNDFTEQIPLFHLIIESQNDLFLKDHLWINSSVIAAEAYHSDDQLFSLNLSFENNPINLSNHSKEEILFQNQPNPFSTSTDIKFYVPVSTNLEFQIFDISGRKIKTLTMKKSAGIHKLTIDKNIFPASGIYFYQITTPSFSASKKMIFIN